MSKDEWIKEVLDILYMIDTTAVEDSQYQNRAKKLYDIGINKLWKEEAE